MACCSTATVVTAAMPLAMAAGSCVGHALLRARRLVERGAGCVVWWRLTRASAPLVQPWWGFFYRELWIADGSPGSARQPCHASNRADEYKSQNNQKFHRIPSLGAKKSTLGFKLSHGSECSVSTKETQQLSECSVSDKRNPAIVGVNLNGRRLGG